MGRRLYILVVVLLLSLSSPCLLSAQQSIKRGEVNVEQVDVVSSIGVALYDVGRLYDTIPSPFYNDLHYTPRGKMHWSSERYQTKVTNIAQVIDSMSMPIVILYGVENRDVVRDIQLASSLDYSSRHATIDYYDGLDFAILYFGDILQINKVMSRYHYAYFGGEIANRSVAIHLTRRGDKLRSLLPVDSNDPADITIAWGRLSSNDIERLGMDEPLQRDEQLGRGDTKSARGWYLKNRIGVEITDGFSIGNKGVYISRYLLTKGGDKPLATHSNRRYKGGYSSHLPQFFFVNINEYSVKPFIKK